MLTVGDRFYPSIFIYDQAAGGPAISPLLIRAPGETGKLPSSLRLSFCHAACHLGRSREGARASHWHGASARLVRPPDRTATGSVPCTSHQAGQGLRHYMSKREVICVHIEGLNEIQCEET